MTLKICLVVSSDLILLFKLHRQNLDTVCFKTGNLSNVHLCFYNLVYRLDSVSDTFRRRKQDRRHKKKSAFALFNRVNVAKAVDDMPEHEFRK